MTVGRQEVHALVGENGSGKSTLIKVLAGFHEADPGATIEVDGVALGTASSWDLGLRFVHQDLGLIGELSAAENVGLASGFVTGRGGRVRWREQAAHARELLARIGVEIDVRTPVADLRPIDRSAIAIARALDTSRGEIRLLVLDEPTAALPPAETEALFRVIREVVAGGVSILYVSHRLDEVLDLASRVTVLRDGHGEGTYDVAGMDRRRLVQLIVGKQIEEHRPAASVAPVAADERPPTLKIRGATARYLRGIDLDLRPGEVTGVAGLSGSGREELAALVSGDGDGQLRVIDAEGRAWDGMTVRRARKLGIALVLANRHPAAAIGSFTIGENLSLAQLPEFVRHGRVDRTAERASVDEWIDRLDIRPRDADREYSYLSGGNKQKVIIGKWLSTSPSVIVADDPTSGVDVGARQAIYGLLGEQAAAGAAVLVCSSDAEDFVGACDRVVALADGRIVDELRGSAIDERAVLAAILAADGETGPEPTAVHDHTTPKDIR